MFRKLLWTTLLITLPLVGVFAQPKTDYSGTWKLNVAKSDFGPLPGPDSRTDVITHKDPSLSNHVTAEGAQGKQEFTFKFTTDGKEAVNTVGPREIKSTVKWSGSNLVINSKFVSNGSDVLSEATWVLSSDGKTLTVSTHFTSSLGEADQKFVFEKQEAAAAPAKATP